MRLPLQSLHEACVKHVEASLYLHGRFAEDNINWYLIAGIVINMIGQGYL